MTPPKPQSQTLRHSKECRCDTCVVDKADKRLAAGIVAQLALTGCIEDSERAEQRALTEICRALLRAEAALAAQEASQPLSELVAAKRAEIQRKNPGVAEWKLAESGEPPYPVEEASPQPDLAREWQGCDYHRVFVDGCSRCLAKRVAQDVFVRETWDAAVKWAQWVSHDGKAHGVPEPPNFDNYLAACRQEQP